MDAVRDDSTRWLEAVLEHGVSEVERLRAMLALHVGWARVRWSSDTLRAFSGDIVSDARADQAASPASGIGLAAWASDDPTGKTLQARVEQRAEEARQVAAAFIAEFGRPPPVDVLCAQLGLDAFERDAMLLAFASEVEPELAPLIAYLHDDARATRPSAALLCALHAADDACARLELLARLTPEGRLVRLRVLRLDEAPARPLHARALVPDPRIVQWLLGRRSLPPSLIEYLVLAVDTSPSAPSPEVASLAGALARLDAAPLLDLVVDGPSDARTLAGRVFEALGLSLIELDVTRIAELDRRELDELVHVLQREVLLLDLAVLVVDPESASDGPLTRLIDRSSLPIARVATGRWRGRRACVTHSVTPSTRAERASWWRAALGEPADDSSRWLTLADHFVLDAADVHRVARSLRSAEPDVEITAEAALAACRLYCRTRPTALGQRVAPTRLWSDLVLPTEPLRQLEDLVAQVEHRVRVEDDWGFTAKPVGLSAMFSGASGTGKTLAAEVIAGRLGLDLYRVDLSGVLNKYVGETEKNLGRVFEEATQAGAVLFFDEADALFAARAHVRDSHDRYANIQVNYLLQCMEAFAGVVLLATNRRAAVDPAFLRRLSFVIDFPIPDLEQRRSLWVRAFPSTCRTDGLDHVALARVELTGGHIHVIARNAAFLAAARGEPVRMEHLGRAASRELIKLDQHQTLPDVQRWLTRRG